MRAQDAVRSTTNGQDEAEAAPVIVSATRTEIPLDQSPSSVSVIDSQDIDRKQIERVGDALREVPGLSVVQTGTPGQLTSVFTRGLRSEHTQVLLDGIPVNQGLQGAFNFADLTTDNIERIEVVRGPQSILYGPRALAGFRQGGRHHKTLATDRPERTALGSGGTGFIFLGHGPKGCVTFGPVPQGRRQS